MAKSRKTSLNRRGFLKGAAVGAAASATALVTTTPNVEAQNAAAAPAGQRGAATAAAPAPTQQQLARDAGNARPPATVRAVNRAGSDLMVQVLKDMGVEFAAANPESTFEGLQESVINYGNPRNVMPEWITALHEESSVTFAHGYGKSEGKPMVAVLHGTIGVQHAAMSIYQAYHGRVPILMIAGRDNPPLVAQHGAADIAGMVRSFTKWDAQPKTLAESLTVLQEAYRQAITPPRGPVLVVLDAELQKEEAHDLAV